MKLFVTLCLVAVACAAPQRDVQVTRYDNDNAGLGYYKWAFEQSDGQTHEQEGELRNQGRENEVLAVKGQYTWVGPDNVKYLIRYIADDRGFQPEIVQFPGGGVPAVVASLLGAR